MPSQVRILPPVPNKQPVSSTGYLFGIRGHVCYNYPRRAAIAQLVERIHGKDEVLGSNPSRGSIL